MLFRLLIFLFLCSPAWAQDVKTKDLADATRREIQSQLDFLMDSIHFRGERGAAERKLKAQTIAEYFFSTYLQSYRSREIVFESAQLIVNEMRTFIEEEPNSLQRLEVLRALEEAFASVYARISNSADFQQSRKVMRNRALFAGFVLSPGLVLGAYLLGDLLILVGRGGDALFYVLPRSLWNTSRLVSRLSALQWARFRGNEARVESCRTKIKALLHKEAARLRHLRRDAQREVSTWGNRLGPRRLVSYAVLGGIFSAGFYYLPIPRLSELSFEDQHDWDAQEDALYSILMPFFADYP